MSTMAIAAEIALLKGKGSGSASNTSSATNVTEESDWLTSPGLAINNIRRIVDCSKCGEKDQVSTTMSCKYCKKMLNMQDDHNKRVLRTMTAELTLNLGVLWRPTTRFSSETTSAIMSNSFYEPARAMNHWTRAISMGYKSIRDRHTRDDSYRELLHLEGITLERMRYWDSIADPALEIEQ